MPDIVIVGAGIVGLGTALLLANDGHQVGVLERDPQSPPELASDAWVAWQRRGVNQFRLPHFVLARYRSVLDQELPEVARAVGAAGGLRYSPLLALPEAVQGPGRADDATWKFSPAGVPSSRPPWPTPPGPTLALPSDAVSPSPGRASPAPRCLAHLWCPHGLRGSAAGRSGKST